MEKHAHEIMSWFGNLYLRITSKKIQERVGGEKQQSIQDLARQAPEGSTLAELLTSVENLNALVQQRMNGLLLADALGDIMITLQKV